MTAETLPRDIPIIPQPIDWVPIGGIGTTAYAGPSTCSACGADIAGDGYGYAGTRPTWTPDLALCHDCASDLAVAFCRETGLQVVLPRATRIQIPTEPAAAPVAEITVALSWEAACPGETFAVAITPEPANAAMEAQALEVAMVGLSQHAADYLAALLEEAQQPAPMPAPGALQGDVLDPRD